MALNAYILNTQRLLQTPPAPSSLYSATDLTAYINEGRGQLAGQAQCVRFMASLALSASQQVYNFSSISLTGSTGIQGVLHVRNIWVQVASGQVWIRPRSFEWFGLYEMNAAIQAAGQPVVWSQFAQGANGSIYVSPVPQQSYTAMLDCVCYPITLASDSDPEAIPYEWTDAIQYYAAYKALLAAQSQARQADAARMFERFEEFVNRARRSATPDVLGSQYEQQPNPTRVNQLGMQKKGSMGLGGLG